MRRNGRMIWKVRPTPASQSSCGLRPDMSRPSSRTSPGARPQEAVEQVEQRGLARAVRPDDAEDLVPAQLEADILHGLQPAEGTREVADLEHDVAGRGRAVRACASERDGRRRCRMLGNGARLSGCVGGAALAPGDRGTFQNSPSGASRMTQMMASPKITPWMPGMRAPASALSISASGIRITAPITGPQTVPTPPNIATVSACADTSMPNTDCGVTTSSTTRVEPADRAGDRAAQGDRAQLPGQRIDAGGFRGGLVLLDGEQRHAETRAFDRAASAGSVPSIIASASSV